MAFDIQGAKAAGYTDEEINKYLSTQGGKKDILTTLGSIGKQGLTYAKEKGAFGPLLSEEMRTGAMRAMQAPSDIVGGMIKATSEGIKSGESPSIAPILKGGVTGFNEQTPVMTELPKAVGVDPESTMGLGIGLAGELLTPDLLDIGAYSKAAKKAAEKIAKITEGIGETVALRGIKASPSQIDKFQKLTGKELGEFVNEKNLSGAVLQNTIDRIKMKQADFDKIAENSGIKISGTDIVMKIQNKIDELSTDLKQIGYKKQVDGLKDLQNEIIENISKRNTEMIDVRELTELRRSIDKEIPDNAFYQYLQGEGVFPKIEKRNVIQDIVKDATKGMKIDGMDLGQIGQELKGLYSLEKIAEKQSLLGKGSNIAGLTPLLSGILGASVSQGDMTDRVKSALGATAFAAFANNPKVVSAISSLLIKGGKKMANSKSFPMLIELILRSGKEAGITKTRGSTDGSSQKQVQVSEESPVVQGL